MLIYILRLQGGNYYVGKTSKKTAESRLAEHKAGRGAEWTRRHHVLGLDKQIPNADDFDEDKWVKIYMRNLGVHKVRGGSYSKATLPSAQKEVIEKELRTSLDQCFDCGGDGHFSKECPKRDPVKARAQQCKGQTLKGKQCQCTIFLTREGYCRAHQEQAREELDDFSSACVADTCLGLTQNGVRCLRTRFLSMEGYCCDHEDQDPAFDTTDSADEDEDSFFDEASMGQNSAAYYDSTLQTDTCRGRTKDGFRCQRRTYLNSLGFCSHHAPEADVNGNQQITTSRPTGHVVSCCGVTKSGSRCQVRTNLNTDGYCNHHAEQYKAAGTTKSGSQCQVRTNLNTDGYCNHHRDQRQVFLLQSAKASYRGQETCRGATKHGSQCQVRTNLNAGGYCNHHTDQQEMVIFPRTANAPHQQRYGEGATCRGETKSGSRCQVRTNLSMNGYCKHHSNQHERLAGNNPKHSTKRDELVSKQQGGGGYANGTTCCGTTKSGSRCQHRAFLDDNGYCQSHACQAFY